MEIVREKIQYRRADINDIDTLVNFRIRFLNEMYKHPDNDETVRLTSSLKEYFINSLPSNKFIAWLAEHDDEVIGTSGMVIWHIPGRYGGLESGKLGYILNLYTIPEARKMGICTELLKKMINEAKSLGLTYLHLHATDDGMNIYKKAGFTKLDLEELKLIL